MFCHVPIYKKPKRDVTGLVRKKYSLLLIIVSLFLIVHLIHFQQVNILFYLNELFSLSSKSVFFTKAAISFLLAKFACDNLEAKSSDVNLLNS